MPVALASPLRCRSGGLRTAICTRRHYARRAPLAWTGQITGRSVLREGLPGGSWEMPLGPSSQRFGHPGSPARIDSGLDCLDRAAPAEILRRCLLAKGDTVGKDRGAFHRNETLTRAKDCSFVRARIAFPSRRLRRGIARGFARLCYRLWRPPTDEESTRSDSTCGDDRAEAFSSLRVAAPVTFSTTESARGQLSIGGTNNRAL